MRHAAAIALAIVAAAPAGITAAQDIDWYGAYRAGYFIGDFDGSFALNGGSAAVSGDTAGIESSIAFGGGFLEFGVAELELLYQYDSESDFELDTGGNFASERTRNNMFGAIASAGARFDYDIFRFSGLAGIGYGFRTMEIENQFNGLNASDSSGALLLQARLGAELRVDDNWGLETFYRYRYEGESDFGFTDRGATTTLTYEPSTDHMIGLGVVYSFGGGEDSGASRANTAATAPTTSRFDSFPPPAQGPVLETASLRADRALTSTIAPPPAAIAELRALRQRLAELEDRAADMGPMRTSVPPQDGFPAALGPYSGMDAPPVAARAPMRALSMAQLASDMRQLRAEITGERQPADPLLGE